jgi:hypothetical protein
MLSGGGSGGAVGLALGAAALSSSGTGASNPKGAAVPRVFYYSPMNRLPQEQQRRDLVGGLLDRNQPQRSAAARGKGLGDA